MWCDACGGGSVFVVRLFAWKETVCFCVGWRYVRVVVLFWTGVVLGVHVVGDVQCRCIGACGVAVAMFAGKMVCMP